MKEINVVIADELVEVAKRIKNVVENISEIKVVKIVTNENVLYSELVKTRTDILFLDASIKNGRQVVEKIIDKNKNSTPYLIYTDTEPTKPSNKPLSNIEVGALIKPYYDEDIIKMVERCKYKDYPIMISSDINKKILKLLKFNKI